MEKKITQGSEEYQMFLDFWNMCKKFWEPEDNDEYWDDLVKAVTAFNKKHKTPYSKHFDERTG